jgi:WD40 repeat protein
MKDVDKWRLADEEVQKNLPLGVKLVYTLRGHNKKIGRIMWSPDGRMLASPSNDKTIRLWDTETGKCLRTIETNFHEIGRRAWQNELLCVAFDPESRFLAFPSVGHNITLLEIETGKICRNFPWKGPKIWSIAISPDGDKLAIAGNGGSSVIYNLHSGELIHHLERDEFSKYCF